MKKIKKDLTNSLISLVPFLSAAITQDIAQIVMLILGGTSFLVSTIYSLIKVFYLLKDKQYLEALNEAQALIDTYENYINKGEIKK